MKKRRAGLGKRIRFEVFKRDQFKCQYCGSVAPEVILVIDHIKPVADGGSSDLLNLTTACVDCNAGKSAVPLSDGSAVKRQRAQLQFLAERREQVAMLVEWRDGLASLEDEKVALLVERANRRLAEFGDAELNAEGTRRVRGWLKRFGFDASIYGIDQAFDSSTAQARYEQMEQFAAAARKVEREPELREFWRIRARLRGRGFDYGPEWAPIQDMRRSFAAGWPIEKMDAAAGEAEDYDHFRSLIGYDA